MTKPVEHLLSPRVLALAGMILLVALTRLLPHPPNFTPVESMALFAGAYFVDRRVALLVPLVAMLLSDLALGLLHGGLYFEHLASVSSLAVYACVALGSIVGLMMRGKVSGTRVLASSLMAAVIFFLVTNFAVWLTATSLPGHSACATGLLPCYVAAIPFFKWTLLGTLFYSMVLFGGYALMQRRWPVLALRQELA
jgi:hypothetical protein